MLFSDCGKRVAMIFVAGAALAGCSPSDPVADPAVPSAPVVSLDAVADSVAVDDGDTSQPARDSAVDAEPSTAEPLRSSEEPPTTSAPSVATTSAYISRLSMTSDAIEVKWSESEGIVEYRIHRIPRTSDDIPPVEAMTDENLLHVAEAGGRFEDEDVEAGTEYWHGVREFSATGELTAHGWHKTAAVDDEEPPAVVDGINAVLDNGEVLVTWTQPDENYELHGYRVLRSVDGEPSETLATTWRLDQRSFVDDKPPTSADVRYEVVAFDFHWNESTPGGITLDLS